MGRKKGEYNCYYGATRQSVVMNTCNYWEVPPKQSLVDQLIILHEYIFNDAEEKQKLADYKKNTISYTKNAEAMRRLRESRKATPRKPRAWL